LRQTFLDQTCEEGSIETNGYSRKVHIDDHVEIFFVAHDVEHLPGLALDSYLLALFVGLNVR
jgi:hypothetical protein